MNYLGSLDEIRNKDWLEEFEKQKRSLTPKGWSNEYSDVTLNDLQIRGTLGVGGFGRVELVTLNADPNKSFALKKLKKKVMVDQQQQEHVLNEKHIMQACDSPFVCKLVTSPKEIYSLPEVTLFLSIYKCLVSQTLSNIQGQEVRLLFDGGLPWRGCVDHSTEAKILRRQHNAIYGRLRRGSPRSLTFLEYCISRLEA